MIEAYSQNPSPWKWQTSVSLDFDFALFAKKYFEVNTKYFVNQKLDEFWSTSSAKHIKVDKDRFPK